MNIEENEHKKVLLALSGGVDSSVAALLLKKAGYDVTAATMKFHVNDAVDAAQAESIQYARDVCEALGIEHLVFDFTEVFRKNVIEYFVGSYENAETPNPCFICNKKIKFGAFLEKALSLGFDAVATGHYAKIVYDTNARRYSLLAQADNPKDQSYFLAYLNQAQLSKIIFPLADLTKPEVKKIARDNNLKTAVRKESQDICFVEDGNYAQIVESFSHKSFPPGEFLSRDGKRLGMHRGIHRYTIGQRRGLHIATGEAVYVLEKRLAQNKIIVAERSELYCKSLSAKHINFIATELLEQLRHGDVELHGKTRYRSTVKKCLVKKIDEIFFTCFSPPALSDSATLHVEFLEPDFAVAAGQALVLYRNDEVLASGIITNANMG